MRLRASVLAIGLVIPARALAQTPPPGDAALPLAGPPPVEAAPPVLASDRFPVKMTWGGLVDTYYLYYFNPASGANSLTPPTGRVFDTNSNSLTLNYAKVSLNAALDPVSFQLDVGYGTTGTIINFANSGYPTVPATATGMLPTAAIPGSFIVQQAYGTISLPGDLVVDFGKFVTTAGAEVIESNRNWLYSRSLLFGVIPLVHTGARLTMKVSRQLSLQASLVNGWNNDPDNNAFKTLGVSASFTANRLVTVMATGYFGKEATQPPGLGTPGDWTLLADLVAAFTLDDKLGFNLNFDYLEAPPLTSAAADRQLGVSGMARTLINDHINAAVRFEWLQSRRMFVTTHQAEVTVMLGLDVGRNFELRPEFRADFSLDAMDAYLFADGTKKSELTGTVAALTWF